MIDLTPLDVRKKRGDFRRILRGYDPEEVDSFLELAAERLEELVKKNLVLAERVERLERSLNALELRESAVQDALVTAQRLRSEVLEQSRRDAETLGDQAQREAQLLKAEAQAEITRRLGEVEGLVLESRRSLEELERSRRKFLKAFRGLLERELDTVEVEEARTPLDEMPLELELRGWFPGGGVTGRVTEKDGEDLDLPGGFDTQILSIAEEPFPIEEPVAAPDAEGPHEEPFAYPDEDSASDAAGDEAYAPDDQAFAAEEPVAAPDAGGPHEEPFPYPDEDSASEAADDVLPVEALAPDPQDDEGTRGPSTAAEPKWLFSLLKRADQIGRKGDV